jgi:uncharacterized protein
VKAAWCFGTTVVVLAAFNLSRSVGWLGPAPVSSAILMAALVLIAWATRTTVADLGLQRRYVRAGLLYGGAAFGLVLAVLIVGALLPATNDSLHDSRAAVSGGQVFYKLLVTILLCTVIPEELAFRGLLLSSARRLWGTPWAVVSTSLLFGAWHITTTLHTRSDNPSVRHTSAALVVLGAVAATSAAGVAFCWLRLRSRSLIAPALAHLATNGLALVVAWFVLH